MPIQNYTGSGGDHARTYGGRLLQKRDSFFVEVADLFVEPALILDAGTGSADLPILMAVRNPELRFVCTDLEEENLVIAREAVAGAGVADRFSFIQCSADALVVPDGSFDAALACGVFSYCVDPVEAVRQFITKVKRGGFVRFDLSRRSADDWLQPVEGLPWGPAYSPVTEEQINEIVLLGQLRQRVEDADAVLIELTRVS